MNENLFVIFRNRSAGRYLALVYLHQVMLVHS